MVTKATNSVLNSVNPAIENMVLLQGTLDNVVIGANVPNVGHFTRLFDTELNSPLVGAPSGRLSEVFLGTGLSLSGNVFFVIDNDPGGPVSPVSVSPVSVSPVSVSPLSVAHPVSPVSVSPVSVSPVI